MKTKSNKKRVAFFGIKFYPSKGGSSRVAEGIARHLKDQYDITIYCYPDDKAKTYLSGVRVIHMPKLPFGTVGVFSYYLLCFLHLFFSRKYDLIHVHKTDSALFIPLLRLRSKVIATSQEAPYVRDKWNWFGKTYFRMMEKFFVRSGALLTSVSKPLAEYYHQTYGAKVHYVPNGADIITTRNKEAAQDILLKHQVGQYLFFAARRIMSTKGCHTFLEAVAKAGIDDAIVIAGEEGHAAAYMDKIRKLAKGLPVYFVGYVGDRATLMSLIEGAKYFIFPSETEGLSLMLLEAASNGQTPIICSDIPENTEVFDEADVLYFRNKDAHDLAEKLLWAEQHPQAMETKAQRAKDRVLRQYTIEAVASMYEQHYQKLLDVSGKQQQVLKTVDTHS